MCVKHVSQRLAPSKHPQTLAPRELLLLPTSQPILFPAGSQPPPGLILFCFLRGISYNLSILKPALLSSYQVLVPSPTPSPHNVVTSQSNRHLAEALLRKAQLSSPNPSSHPNFSLRSPSAPSCRHSPGLQTRPVLGGTWLSSLRERGHSRTRTKT